MLPIVEYDNGGVGNTGTHRPVRRQYRSPTAEGLGVPDEADEATDTLGQLPAPANAGISTLGTSDGRLNRSGTSLGGQHKAESDLDPQPCLTSLYLVSGLGKDPSQWSRSDTDTTRGVQPMEDSLGVFWRPDMLGNTFSGEKSSDQWGTRQGKKTKRGLSSVLRRDIRSKVLPNAGPEGASRLVARTMKYAHPKDVEVVNSTLEPPTTCHTFTFTVPRHNTLSAAANSGSKDHPNGASTGYPNSHSYSNVSGDQSTMEENVRGHQDSSDLIFYGVTLTVWSHADKVREVKLKELKQATANRTSVSSETANRSIVGTPNRAGQAKRLWNLRSTNTENTASEKEVITGTSDSDVDTTFIRGNETESANEEDFAAAYGGESCDIFWMPYAITLVSRFPIYDVMQDYLRLSWAKYSKEARAHMRQICCILNCEAPRPGDIFRLPIGMTSDDEVTIEAVMPGAIDFEKGTVKVDFQMWPLFQALDIDHILTCMEVALSHSGRIIFCSRHPAMLGAAVDTLKYIVELRGWDGIALPNIHARDATFMIEDPGPYIIGLATESRYLINPPHEVIIIDLDLNTLYCKSPPAGVITPYQKRERVRAKIATALGQTYPTDRSVPMEYRVSYPKGSFRNINRILHGPARPRYLSERLRSPEWWNQTAVIGLFDKIMADKHKKPSLLQRLTKSGLARAQQQLSTNELIAKSMMRKRALHYVEKRDDFDLKVARINRRLQKLIQEGDNWKARFEMFEKHAERLAHESNELKAKIDRERREARRLSNINDEQNKHNSELQARLRNTEAARAEAMRQLSDMHQSIQDLERERNEIMDVIEMQISNALENIPFEDSENGSRSSSPTDAVLSSATTVESSAPPRRKSQRPTTGDSTRSGLSRFTIESQPISVLGAFRAVSSVRRGEISFMDRDQLQAVDVLIGNKPDSIAARVALIQAKLELALGAVHDHERYENISTSASNRPRDHKEVDGAHKEETSETLAANKNEINLEDTPLNVLPHAALPSLPATSILANSSAVTATPHAVKISDHEDSPNDFPVTAFPSQSIFVRPLPRQSAEIEPLPIFDAVFFSATSSNEEYLGPQMPTPASREAARNAQTVSRSRTVKEIHPSPSRVKICETSRESCRLPSSNFVAVPSASKSAISLSSVDSERKLSGYEIYDDDNDDDDHHVDEHPFSALRVVAASVTPGHERRHSGISTTTVTFGEDVSLAGSV